MQQNVAAAEVKYPNSPHRSHHRNRHIECLTGLLCSLAWCITPLGMK